MDLLLTWLCVACLALAGIYAYFHHKAVSLQHQINTSTTSSFLALVYDGNSGGNTYGGIPWSSAQYFHSMVNATVAIGSGRVPSSEELGKWWKAGIFQAADVKQMHGVFGWTEDKSLVGLADSGLVFSQLAVQPGVEGAMWAVLTCGSVQNVKEIMYALNMSMLGVWDLHVQVKPQSA